jgi:hypothetical protein
MTDALITVSDILGEHKFSCPTFRLWKTKYGGVGVADMRSLNAFGRANARPKRMHA